MALPVYKHSCSPYLRVSRTTSSSIFGNYQKLQNFNFLIRVEVGGKVLTENPDFHTLDDFNNLRSPSDFEDPIGFTFISDDHFSTPTFGLALTLLELSTTLLYSPDLKGLLSFGILPLVKIVSNYALMRKEEEEIWQHDPNQYLESDENEGDFWNMRNIALNFLSNLIERFGTDAIKGIMCVIENMLFGGDTGEDKRSADVFFSLLKTGKT